MREIVEPTAFYLRSTPNEHDGCGIIANIYKQLFSFVTIVCLYFEFGEHTHTKKREKKEIDDIINDDRPK